MKHLGDLVTFACLFLVLVVFLIWLYAISQGAY